MRGDGRRARPVRRGRGLPGAPGRADGQPGAAAPGPPRPGQGHPGLEHREGHRAERRAGRGGAGRPGRSLPAGLVLPGGRALRRARAARCAGGAVPGRAGVGDGDQRRADGHLHRLDAILLPDHGERAPRRHRAGRPDAFRPGHGGPARRPPAGGPLRRRPAAARDRRRGHGAGRPGWPGWPRLNRPGRGRPGCCRARMRPAAPRSGWPARRSAAAAGR